MRAALRIPIVNPESAGEPQKSVDQAAKWRMAMFADQAKTVKADGVLNLMKTAAGLALDIAKKAEALVPNVAPTKNVTVDGVIMTRKPVKQMGVWALAAGNHETAKACFVIDAMLPVQTEKQALIVTETRAASVKDAMKKLTHVNKIFNGPVNVQQLIPNLRLPEASLDPTPQKPTHTNDQ